MAARPGLKEAGNNSRDLLRGWCGYFGHCDDYWTLRDLDSWIRRRLRSLAWRAWRTPRKRFYELVRRGVDRNLAMRMIYFRTGSWDTSNSMAMSYAMPDRYLHECLKLISLLQARPTITNRRVRTRTHGGVGGVEPQGSPLSRSRGGSDPWKQTLLPPSPPKRSPSLEKMPRPCCGRNRVFFLQEQNSQKQDSSPLSFLCLGPSGFVLWLLPLPSSSYLCASVPLCQRHHLTKTPKSSLLPDIPRPRNVRYQPK